MILTHGESEMLGSILNLSCEAQLIFAQSIAANIGYEVKAENTAPTIEQRLDRLEKLMAHVIPDKSDDI